MELLQHDLNYVGLNKKGDLKILYGIKQLNEFVVRSKLSREYLIKHPEAIPYMQIVFDENEEIMLIIKEDYEYLATLSQEERKLFYKVYESNI